MHQRIKTNNVNEFREIVKSVRSLKGLKEGLEMKSLKRNPEIWTSGQIRIRIPSKS